MTPPRLRLAAPLAAAAVLLLAGCSGDDDPGAAASTTPSTTIVPRTTPPTATTLPPVPSTGTGAPSAITASYCESLVPLRDVTTLVGTPMGGATVVPVIGVPGCTWSATSGTPTSVQVVNASSSTWGARLPDLQRTLETQGTPLGDQTRADLATAAGQAASGFEVDADLACEIFTELAADTGYGDDVSGIVRVQAQGTQTSLVVEACTADEYSFLQVTAPDLGDQQALVERAEQTLLTAHGAPVQFAGPL